MVELVIVFVYVNLPTLSHCSVLTVELVDHQAHRKPDKREVNADPDITLSRCCDVQT